MKLARLCALSVFAIAAILPASAAEISSPLEFTIDSIDGKQINLSKYKGSVVLMVNVASKCGLTPQYEQLEAIHTKYKDKGFTVMGFPANQFMGQEPGSNEQIAQFCAETYKVDFPMFSKLVVKGDGIAPLYQYLTSLDTAPAKKGDITWNFEKFLVGRDGKVVKRFAPRTKPDAPEVIAAIEEELNKK